MLGFRSHTCAALPPAGTRVLLAGWVAAVRRQKALDFIVLRDAFGTVQVVHASPQHKLHEEDVVSVSGVVQARPGDGQLEVVADGVKVENTARHPLPLSVRHDDEAPTPQQRDAGLTHRYLELRRPELQQNLRLRAKVASAMRNFMADEAGFLEVETCVALLRVCSVNRHGGARVVLSTGQRCSSPPLKAPRNFSCPFKPNRQRASSHWRRARSSSSSSSW